MSLAVLGALAADCDGKASGNARSRGDCDSGSEHSRRDDEGYARERSYDEGYDEGYCNGYVAGGGLTPLPNRYGDGYCDGYADRAGDYGDGYVAGYEDRAGDYGDGYADGYDDCRGDCDHDDAASARDGYDGYDSRADAYSDDGDYDDRDDAYSDRDCSYHSSESDG